jgi:hypothetical protein
MTVRPRLICRSSSSNFYLKRFDGVRFKRYTNTLTILDHRFSNSEALIRIQRLFTIITPLERSAEPFYSNK